MIKSEAQFIEQLIWAPRWVRPYESNESILAKIGWLNNLTAHGIKTLSALLESGDLRTEQKIFGGHARQHRLPRNPVASRLITQLSICRICITAGFHSHLPHLVGARKCPIHRTLLICYCECCRSPIQSFGISDFVRTSIYICTKCRRPLAKCSKNILKEWLGLTDYEIFASYQSSIAILEEGAHACAGLWNLHFSDASRVYSYLTGQQFSDYRIAEKPGKMLELMKEMTIFKYKLPLPHEEMEEFVRIVQARDRLHYIGAFEGTSLGTVPNKFLPTLCESGERVMCYRESDILANALSVHDQLIYSAARSPRSHPFWNEMVNTSSTSKLCQHQAAILTAAHALSQILRQMEIAQKFLYDNYNLDELRPDALNLELVADDMYSGSMRLSSVFDGRGNFHTSSGRFLPSYQVKKEGDGFILQVFVRCYPSRFKRPYLKKISY